MYGHVYHLADMTALKSVTVNDCDTLEGDREQWSAWESDMKQDFFRDGPVPYSVLIVGEVCTDVLEGPDRVYRGWMCAEGSGCPNPNRRKW